MVSEARKRWRLANPDYDRQWRKANPDKVRESNRRWREKHPDVMRRVRKQPVPTRVESEWCDCCGRLFDCTPHLDHDHVTGKFRGWLCSQCNTGIGLLGDDLPGVEKAAAYLRRRL